jgi:two-component system, NarL family, nitrate/nitrite response regulator NarL
MVIEGKIRILLIDDHGLFRESLSRLLSAEKVFELVGDFASVPEGVEALSKQVDVVLLDFDLGERTGLDFFTLSRARGFAGRVLVVTAGLTNLDTLRVMERGAAGIFLKHRSPSELVLAIRTIVKGEPWLDSGSVAALVSAASASKEETNLLLLSPKERDVLRAVFEGLTNKEIGTKLDISEAYVKALLQQLFNKTGVRNRSQLVRVALENQAWHGIELGPQTR